MKIHQQEFSKEPTRIQLKKISKDILIEELKR